MPIENERKYILDDRAGTLERHLAACPGITGLNVLQAYVTEDTRIRRFTPLDGGPREYVFSFKRKVAGDQIEIETPISREDFRALLPTASISFVKHRFKFAEGDVHWDVDFLKTRAGSTYFALAEAEMPAGMAAPASMPGPVSAHLLLDVGDARGFGARRLADTGYALKLLSGLRARADRKGMLPSLDASEYCLGMPPRLSLAA